MILFTANINMVGCTMQWIEIFHPTDCNRTDIVDGCALYTASLLLSLIPFNFGCNATMSNKTWPLYDACRNGNLRAIG
jgi:hypothetical protein